MNDNVLDSAFELLSTPAGFRLVSGLVAAIGGVVLLDIVDVVIAEYLRGNGPDVRREHRPPQLRASIVLLLRGLMCTIYVGGFVALLAHANGGEVIVRLAFVSGALALFLLRYGSAELSAVFIALDFDCSPFTSDLRAWFAMVRRLGQWTFTMMLVAPPALGWFWATALIATINCVLLTLLVPGAPGSTCDS